MVTMRLLLIVGFFQTVSAQTITISNESVQIDKPIIITGKTGSRTNNIRIQIYNQSDFDLDLALIADSLNHFIYFQNRSDDNLKNTAFIPPGQVCDFIVYTYLGEDAEMLHTEITLQAENISNKKVNFKVDLILYSYKTDSEKSNTFNKPKRYKCISINDKPARWQQSDLPLKIYSNHHAYGFNEDYSKIIQRATNIWNAAGITIGMKQDFFVMARDISDADISIDWSGNFRNNPKYKNFLGAADPINQLIGMLPLEMYENLGQATETITQELCHLLGVEHSDKRNDIMNGSAHGHWHDLSEIGISERDRQMLGWLYSITEYHAFEK